MEQPLGRTSCLKRSVVALGLARAESGRAAIVGEPMAGGDVMHAGGHRIRLARWPSFGRAILASALRTPLPEIRAALRAIAASMTAAALASTALPLTSARALAHFVNANSEVVHPCL